MFVIHEALRGYQSIVIPSSPPCMQNVCLSIEVDVNGSNFMGTYMYYCEITVYLRGVHITLSRDSS